MVDQDLDTYNEFLKNLRLYFVICITLGFIFSMVGTFLPSDMLFIVGVIALVMGIGLGLMDFMYRVKDKKNKEKLV